MRQKVPEYNFYLILLTNLDRGLCLRLTEPLSVRLIMSLLSCMSRLGVRRNCAICLLSTQSADCSGSRVSRCLTTLTKQALVCDIALSFAAAAVKLTFSTQTFALVPNQAQHTYTNSLCVCTGINRTRTAAVPWRS